MVLLEAFEERDEDAESWERDLSLFIGLLFSEAEPVSWMILRENRIKI